MGGLYCCNSGLGVCLWVWSKESQTASVKDMPVVKDMKLLLYDNFYIVRNVRSFLYLFYIHNAGITDLNAIKPWTRWRFFGRG